MAYVLEVAEAGCSCSSSTTPEKVPLTLTGVLCASRLIVSVAVVEITIAIRQRVGEVVRAARCRVARIGVVAELVHDQCAEHAVDTEAIGTAAVGRCANELRDLATVSTGAVGTGGRVCRTHASDDVAGCRCEDAGRNQHRYVRRGCRHPH